MSARKLHLCVTQTPSYAADMQGACGRALYDSEGRRVHVYTVTPQEVTCPDCLAWIKPLGAVAVLFGYAHERKGIA